MYFIDYFERIWVVYPESDSALVLEATYLIVADVRDLQSIPFVGWVVPTERYCGEGVHGVLGRIVPMPKPGLCVGGYVCEGAKELHTDTSHCALLIYATREPSFRGSPSGTTSLPMTFADRRQRYHASRKASRQGVGSGEAAGAGEALRDVACGAGLGRVQRDDRGSGVTHGAVGAGFVL
jgi:hypothetical protein